ncbi:MAG: histidine kinase, partial [Amphiplicatus sp.]
RFPAALEQQVAIRGPKVALHGIIAPVLGLVFHELTVNAQTFGALATSTGQIEVIWRISRGPAPRLSLLWRESGVSALDTSPAHLGFGRGLIEQALPFEINAKTSLKFGSGGIECRIEAPMTRVSPVVKQPP